MPQTAEKKRALPPGEKTRAQGGEKRGFGWAVCAVPAERRGGDWHSVGVEASQLTVICGRSNFVFRQPQRLRPISLKSQSRHSVGATAPRCAAAAAVPPFPAFPWTRSKLGRSIGGFA